MVDVKRTERGWAGHFICAHRCKFRRNTLLELDGQAVVVSTVGALENPVGGLEKLGCDRYYETMAFAAAPNGAYLDADVSIEIPFSSLWHIEARSESELPDNVDILADNMHEAVVDELIDKLIEAVCEKCRMEDEERARKDKALLMNSRGGFGALGATSPKSKYGGLL